MLVGLRVPVAVGLALQALASCTPSQAVDWPLPDTPGARALIVHLSAQRGNQLVALDLDASSAPALDLPFLVEPDGSVEATVLALAEPLSHYALTPGPQLEVARAEGRPWPPTIAVLRRGPGDEAFIPRPTVEDTPLVARAIDATPLCPVTTGLARQVDVGEVTNLIAVDRGHALLATELALYLLSGPTWEASPVALPGPEPIRSMWRGSDAAILAGGAYTARLYAGRWDGSGLRWVDETDLDRPSSLAALTSGPAAPVYGVTQDGRVLRISAEGRHVDDLFAFQAQLPNMGAGVALRDAQTLVAYSNVDPGRVVYIDGDRLRAESPFLGPLNVLVPVSGLGVVAGSVLGLSLLAPGAVSFRQLGRAPLEPQALVETRDGFLALGTAGLVLRYDRRSGHSCPAQPLGAAQFRAAVGLDDETVLALEQPARPGEPFNLWELRVPGLPF